MKKSKKAILLGILIVILLVASFSYAFFSIYKERDKYDTLGTKCLDLNLINERNDISITDAYPMSDEEGLITNSFDFTLTNRCDNFNEIRIYLNVLDRSTLNTEYVKTNLTDFEEPLILSGLEKENLNLDGVRESYLLQELYMNNREDKDFSLQLWLDENAGVDALEKTFVSKIHVVATLIDQSKLEREFVYTGEVEEFTALLPGYYFVELWGAKGAGTDPFGNETHKAGMGGYTSGYVYLEEHSKVYFTIGGQGRYATPEDGGSGYNGGGNGLYVSDTNYSGGGGGATDMRYFGEYNPSENDLLWNSELGIKSRIMVAGGGGGANRPFGYVDAWNDGFGGHGGNIIAQSGGNKASYSPYLYGDNDGTLRGGAQTGGYRRGQGESIIPGNAANGAGGSGYYGGGAYLYTTNYHGGGGGSSFISGHAGVIAIDLQGELSYDVKHYSGKYFLNSDMKSGISNSDGKARISYYDMKPPKRTNEVFDGVRYIKDCMDNGFSQWNYKHWSEIQVIKDGINLARNGVTTWSASSNFTISNLFNNGIANFDNKFSTTKTGEQCIILDLGDNYDIDQIGIWHQASVATNTYDAQKTQVSKDNIEWITINDEVYVETVNGKYYSAWD